jgi:hypothetical protein
MRFLSNQIMRCSWNPFAIGVPSHGILRTLREPDLFRYLDCDAEGSLSGILDVLEEHNKNSGKAGGATGAELSEANLMGSSLRRSRGGREHPA